MQLTSSKNFVLLESHASHLDSGQCRNVVRPCLDLSEDRIVRVGLERDPVAAEHEIVQLAVCIMAPERCGERVVLCVMDRCACMGCSNGGGCGESRAGRRPDVPSFRLFAPLPSPGLPRVIE